MHFAEFNNKPASEKADIFHSVRSKQPARFVRSGPGPIDRCSAVFVFVEGMAIVRLDAGGKTEYFACDARAANAVIDRSVDIEQQKALEHHTPFGDDQMTSDYLSAAQFLYKFIATYAPGPLYGYC